MTTGEAARHDRTTKRFVHIGQQAGATKTPPVSCVIHRQETGKRFSGSQVCASNELNEPSVSNGNLMLGFDLGLRLHLRNLKAQRAIFVTSMHIGFLDLIADIEAAGAGTGVALAT